MSKKSHKRPRSSELEANSADDNEQNDEPEFISKSARKREMTALQKTGEALLALPAKQFAKVPISDLLREALELARIAGTFGADVFEISELCPQYDVSDMSTKLVCCMIYHYLGSRAETLRNSSQRP